MSVTRAAFLDRDGTILEEKGYVTEPAAVALLPGAAAAIAALNRAGWRVVVVTNQAAVARGLMTEADLAAVHRRMVADLAALGAQVDAVYACPHHPEGLVAGYRTECDCRKPAPGLLRRAAADHGLDLAASVMVGDALRDLEAGRAAGVGATVLVRTGLGEATFGLAHGADHVAPDLAAAAAWIAKR